MYPNKFEKIIEILEKLPGVGNKTAQRYAFNLLNKNEDEIDEFVDALKGLKEIKKCKVCGFLTDSDECEFCKDKTRDKDTIIVVENSQDVMAIERTNSYKGSYHILGGLISSSKGIYPEDIAIKELLNRINNNSREIILATSPTMDGEMTALYLDKILKDKNIKVTRLANGLPMGSNLDYADELTLIKAMMNRTEIKEN